MGRAAERSRATFLFATRSKLLTRSAEAMIRDENSGRLMANPFKFLQEVRAEASKVTWPTRRETMITTGLVALMVVMAAIFFVSVDQVIRLAVGFILGFGH
jgi:preprotein translocase subunit SecE